jgi:hypothetical protein
MEVEAHRMKAAFTRKLDLAGASNATLSYTYSIHAGAGSVAFEISADGSNWATLASYSLGSAREDLSASFDITPFASSVTQLRVRVTKVNDEDFGVLGIDNVRVDASIPEESCVVAAPPAAISTGNMLDTFAVSSGLPAVYHPTGCCRPETRFHLRAASEQFG